MTAARAPLVFALLVAAIGSAPAAPEQSWIKPKAEQSLLVDIEFHAGRWTAVGERGHVLVSDDAEVWKQVRVPTRVLLTAVSMGAQGLGFAVGHDATIIRTRDNGESWERVYYDPAQEAPFLDVTVAGDRVVAVGAYGLYVESDDAGDSWEVRVLEPEELDGAAAGSDQEEFYYDYHLNDIVAAGDGRWYIAAEAGNVYRSENRGETWSRLPSPYEGSFFGVLPLDAGEVLLFGLQGRLFHSGDAGKSWTRIDTGTDATLSNGLRLPGGGVLITGYAGTVLTRTGAGGAPSRVTLANRPAVADAYRLENGDLLTVGEGGIRRWPAKTLSGP